MSEAKNSLKLTMIAAALPPQLDGIGDYTANLAEELAKTAKMSVLTCDKHLHTPLLGVKIVPAFSPNEPTTCRALVSLVQAETPDWVILQYNPFAYGKWGRNPYLPQAMAQIKKRLPQTHVAIMVHEPFVPIINAKFAIMATWQRHQLWQLGQNADIMFFSIDPWAQRFRHWFPHTPVHHLPVGSNIPRVSITRQEARLRLGIAEDAVVLSLFGGMHISRLPDHVRAATQAIHKAGKNGVLLYMGPHSRAVREAVPAFPLIAEGPLSAEEVSLRFAAADINLSPFSDGISTRRTSLMTALQHGIATVGTYGCHTDAMLLQENGKAFLLANANAPEEFAQHVLHLAADALRRQEVGQAGQCLYMNEFTWDCIAKRLLSTLNTAPSQDIRRS